MAQDSQGAQLTFVLRVCDEGQWVRGDHQSAEFTEEHAEHRHAQALVLGVVQEVDRTVDTSSGRSGI